MTNNTELVRLEEFVDKLLGKYKALQQAYAVLEAKLEEQEGHCERLRGTIEELRSERSVVGDRVNGLIDRIEKWESEMDSGEFSSEVDLAKQQGSLFQDGQSADSVGE